jgi:hypothetical protein
MTNWFPDWTLCVMPHDLSSSFVKVSFKNTIFFYVYSIIFYSIDETLWIMTNSKNMGFCRDLFKTMEILPFYSQYIFPLLMYLVQNKHLFTKNLEVHNHDSRSANNFHITVSNLTKYQKGAHYTWIKIFYHVPTHIKCIANYYKWALKMFLFSNSFHSSEEYLSSNKNIYSVLLCLDVIIIILFCSHGMIILFSNLTAWI